MGGGRTAVVLQRAEERVDAGEVAPAVDLRDAGGDGAQERTGQRDRAFLADVVAGVAPDDRPGDGHVVDRGGPGSGLGGGVGRAGAGAVGPRTAVVGGIGRVAVVTAGGVDLLALLEEDPAGGQRGGVAGDRRHVDGHAGRVVEVEATALFGRGVARDGGVGDRGGPGDAPLDPAATAITEGLVARDGRVGDRDRLLVVDAPELDAAPALAGGVAGDGGAADAHRLVGVPEVEAAAPAVRRVAGDVRVGDGDPVGDLVGEDPATTATRHVPTDGGARDRCGAVDLVERDATAVVLGDVARDRRAGDRHAARAVGVDGAADALALGAAAVGGVAGERGATDRRGLGVEQHQGAGVRRGVALEGRVGDLGGAFVFDRQGAGGVTGTVGGEGRPGHGDRRVAVGGQDRAAPVAGGVGGERGGGRRRPHRRRR